VVVPVLYSYLVRERKPKIQPAEDHASVADLALQPGGD